MNPPQQSNPPAGARQGEGGQQDDRKARLAEQLRANLPRRKAQARLRRAGLAGGQPEGQAGSEGDGAEGGG